MSPSTHLLLSWLVAANIGKNRHERMLLTVSGVAADFDGAGLLIDIAAPIFGQHTNFWFAYHHRGHSIWGALLVCAAVGIAAKTNKLKLAFTAIFLFHLHILCDLIGSKGPDGYQWPIAYFYPVYPDLLLTVSWQWVLNSWQNILFSILLIFFVVKKSLAINTSPFEIVSIKLDQTFIKMIKKAPISVRSP